MKRLWLILFVLLFFSCDDKEQTVDCNINATLKDYTGIDGCKFVLVLENGGVLEMGDFDEEPNFFHFATRILMFKHGLHQIRIFVCFFHMVNSFQRQKFSSVVVDLDQNQNKLLWMMIILQLLRQSSPIELDI